MTPARFSECLLRLRWTPINLASALQCDLALVEAWESGEEEIPAKLAAWLETLAKAHDTLDIPKTYRGWQYGPKQ
ncbi:hypothetical protein [Rhizobium sp. BK251]|uniref:hypothetical protein n=1 Tax=Rhizobium sp. BK251 TaxID=2512125 RepID=UPI00104A73F2|nr:hypothetical protein [Rhizobium sp. BK251]TCL70518.1 hypothetical protein EV286_107393 [Rhizobium sp. BK251]